MRVTARPAGARDLEVDELVTRIAALEAPDVFAALGSAPGGLAPEDAAARLAATGPNALPETHRRSVWRELARQFAGYFALLLLLAAALTLLAWLLEVPRTPGNLELALGICAVVVLNALIGFLQEAAAERTAEALQAMVPATARAVRGGERVELAVAELVPGDVVVLEAGDSVPADCRVVEAAALSVDMSALTGESRPVRRSAAAVALHGPGVDARNCVYMGTALSGGEATAVVFATGAATEFGRIYQLSAGQREERSPLERQVGEMAKRVAAIAVGIGVVLFGLRSLAGDSVVSSFIFALGVMVALVPEGLPATLSVSLAVAVKRMARRHALIRRLSSVEALGSTTVICTDKTGTLTKAEMTVRSVFVAGRYVALTGVGYSPEGVVEDPGRVRELLRVAALCCDARLLPPAPAGRSHWRVLGDTTEGALLAAAAKAGIVLADEALRAPRRTVFPFDASRKLMTTVHEVAGGFEAYVKGAPQSVLERSVAVDLDGETVPLDAQRRAALEAANDDLARGGLRVLAVAHRAVPSGRPAESLAEQGLTVLGLVGMSDPPRPEVADAVLACRRAGIRIVMATGDYGLTAEAIGRDVGIVTHRDARIVSGAELDAMDDDALGRLVETRRELVFARVRPEHKLRIVTALEDAGEIVAVTGDGVNDAPALKRASIGVAMGVSGTDVARAASTMILLDDSFASIAVAVALGRSVYQNIRRFLVYLFSHNLAELSPILVAAAVRFPLVPLSALQVLAIDLGSDVLPALALGTEPGEEGTMDRPPRPPGEHLLSAAVFRRFLFLGAIQSAAVVGAFFWRIHTAHLPFAAFRVGNPTYREALTMTQAGIVVSQFFNSLSVRTDLHSVFRIGLFSNRRVVAAGLFGIGLMAAISYLPALEAVFHTAPLRVVDWVIAVASGCVLLGADETRKAFLRRRNSGHQASTGAVAR